MSAQQTVELTHEQKKARVARRRRTCIGIGIVIFIVGFIPPFIKPQFSWGYIGALAGLIALILVFVRDSILEATETDAGMTATGVHGIRLCYRNVKYPTRLAGQPASS